jgi:hypothetical protein
VCIRTYAVYSIVSVLFSTYTLFIIVFFSSVKRVINYTNLILSRRRILHGHITASARCKTAPYGGGRKGDAIPADCLTFDDVFARAQKYVRVHRTIIVRPLQQYTHMFDCSGRLATLLL